MVEIRKATIKDLEEIQKLCSALFDYEYCESGDKTLNLKWIFGKAGEKYIREAISKKDSCAVVAVDNEKIVGYMEGNMGDVEEYRDVPKVAKVESFFVSDDFRGGGIGKNLYDSFVEWCKEQGVKMIRVETTANNKGAGDFYRKMGLKDYTVILEGEI